MSVAEIKAEIEKLSPEEKKRLREALDAEISPTAKEPTTMAEYLGSLRGPLILKPGWDSDEPLEQWNAERDDVPL
jgi:hypothetical protein